MAVTARGGLVVTARGGLIVTARKGLVVNACHWCLSAGHAPAPEHEA
eukprot:CAMPEP_0119513830 /NCGR_PEP_ID=MMETSP1344-20130328/31819_1 /TAXON_ID=236787 /ORGANISM="Florenciella parvula, Strain CCMP2471" /LENGTH=46 /DNA_ID= /DNA_START= /DNA_END= /DNA_ORIENTATION=